MRVQILVSGPYTDRRLVPGLAKARLMRAGEIVDFPEAYAGALQAAGLVAVVEDQALPEEAPPADEEPAPVKATAAAWKLARKEGIDLASIEGTGDGGKVTVNDVREYGNGG